MIISYEASFTELDITPHVIKSGENVEPPASGHGEGMAQTQQRVEQQRNEVRNSDMQISVMS